MMSKNKSDRSYYDDYTYSKVRREECCRDLKEGRFERMKATALNLLDERPKVVACAAILSCTLCGSIAAKIMMHLTWVEAVYFAIPTITTVGYGDLNLVRHLDEEELLGMQHHHRHVQSAMMTFVELYILVGVGTMFASVTLLFSSRADMQPATLWRSARKASAAFGALVLVGAVGACTLEGWVWDKGLYWAVVTLSTVGYGHLVPVSAQGRLFASAFMLVGVACEATLFTSLAMLPVAERRSRLQRAALRQLGEPPLLEEELIGGRLYTGPMARHRHSNKALPAPDQRARLFRLLRSSRSTTWSAARRSTRRPTSSRRTSRASARGTSTRRRETPPQLIPFAAPVAATRAHLRPPSTTHTPPTLRIHIHHSTNNVRRRLHVLNSTVVKLSKLTRAEPVYRGTSNGVLPKSFWEKNEQGVRGGVDAAFMSTTRDRRVAVGYASGATPMIFEMRQGALRHRSNSHRCPQPSPRVPPLRRHGRPRLRTLVAQPVRTRIAEPSQPRRIVLLASYCSP